MEIPVCESRYSLNPTGGSMTSAGCVGAGSLVVRNFQQEQRAGHEEFNVVGMGADGEGGLGHGFTG